MVPRDTANVNTDASVEASLFTSEHGCTLMYTHTQPTAPVKTVTFTDFRRRASGLLDLVERGETIHVLRHGKVVARIVPAADAAAQPSWKRRGLRLAIPGAKVAEAILNERRARA